VSGVQQAVDDWLCKTRVVLGDDRAAAPIFQNWAG
jgi:hypothetical protein